MVNKDYFEKIDTERKAYFLGLIYADGNVIKNIFQIVLIEEDFLILDLLRKELNVGRKLQYINRNNSKWKNCYRFGIYNKKIVTDLYSWGVVERKTYSEMKLPKIDHSLMRHFIRGFLDGDGFISITESNYLKKDGYTNYSVRKVLGFSNSSLLLLKEISEFLSKELNISGGKIYNTSGTGSTVNSYNLWFFRNNEVISIIDYIYQDATVFIQRKFEKGKVCKLTPREIRILTGLYPRNA